jgi:chain length determinant protein EpsF
MTAQQLFLVFRARFLVIILVFACVVISVLAACLLWPKTYQSKVSLVVDSVSPEPVSGRQPAVELLPTDLATQLEVIASHNVALKVVAKLDLTTNAYFKDHYIKATGGRGSSNDWIADNLLQKNLDAHLSSNRPTKQSNVIEIAAYARDPQTSANLANAFAEAYIQTHLELRAEPSRRQAVWFDDQLQMLRNALVAAQLRLSTYQRANSVVGTDAKVDVENVRLAEISNQLIAAQTAMYDGQTRLKQMNEALRLGKLQELPDIAGNTLLQNEKSNLAVAEGKLAQIGASFGNNHPDYMSAEAQVKALTRKLLNEVQIAKGSVEQAAQIAARQEAQLRIALDRQRDQVLTVKKQQDEQNMLKLDVDSAQRAYDAAEQRATQVKLESRLDQSSVAILNAAIPALFPTYPKILLSAALSVVLGLVLGTGVVLILELRDPRLRAGEDIGRAADIALLAEIPSLDANTAIRRMQLSSA